MKPTIAFNNMASKYSTLVATNEDATYPVENLTTWLPYEWFSTGTSGTDYVTFTFAEAIPVDYFSVFSHNLGETESFLKFQYYDGANWQDLTLSLSQNNSQVIMRIFTEVSATQFRIELVAGTSNVLLGVIAFGKRMDMPVGVDGRFYLPHLQSTDKIINNRSETGLLLGRSVVARSNKSTFDFSVVSQDWVRANWLEFFDHSRNDPFFVSWDAENYPDDAVFCVTDGIISSPKFNEGNFMSLKLKCESWHQLRV